MIAAAYSWLVLIVFAYAVSLDIYLVDASLNCVAGVWATIRDIRERRFHSPGT